MTTPAAVIQEAETSFIGTSTPKSTTAFDVVMGDVLVACHLCAENHSAGTTDFSVTDSSGILTWDLHQVVTDIGFPRVTVWAATVPSDITGLVGTFTRTGGFAVSHGGNIITLRDGEAGASNLTHVDPGAPSLNFDTTADNSVIIVASADRAAVDGGSRVWRAGAGAVTELTYVTAVTVWTAYLGYHADAGVLGTYTVGLSAPSGQKYSIVAIEIKSTAIPPVPEQTDLITLTAAS